jgi:hypothetical protein
MSSGLYNEGLFREGLLRTTNLVRPGLITQFDTLEEALTRFAVNGVEAALALDFIGGEYRTANTATTFAEAFTGTSPKLTYSTSAGSNSTMTNSAGNIVWAPHNLLANSEDFTTWFVSSGATVGSPTLPDPTGSNSASQIVLNTAADFVQLAVSGLSTTAETHFRAWVKGTGTVRVGNVDAGSYDEITLTSEWRLVDVTQTPSADTRFPRFLAPASGGVTFEVFGAHVYRSDLGGMHPVPGAVGDFEYYVPTNGNAEYLPRVGHHVYNGSTWVNEGLLIESEPRTNLVTYSDLSSGWGEVRVDISTVSTATAPDGTSNVTAITSDLTPANSHRANEIVANPLSSTGTFTYSAFVRANGTNVQMDVNIDPAGTVQNRRIYVLFDLQAGTAATPFTLGSPNVIDYGIQDAGGGWYRCHVTTDNPDGTRVDVALTLSQSPNSTQNPAFDGDGTSLRRTV